MNIDDRVLIYVELRDATQDSENTLLTDLRAPRSQLSKHLRICMSKLECQDMINTVPRDRDDYLK